ncbi:aminotransferase class V-fold PLP-dependent enzyme [Streptomyces beijiangensis]|uniref:Aminotransferase class V-fold PLP-dependent enzyme n=1 Tax=Streptomyces beijiangensis TaxID=163361 RepID=A0A939JM02_9ACTN|nr:aminotransferase class V-fold PLP-dependent enzyme [Streptomyces beijiangensis]MBO0516920.1 aminotransferase class V-fold PLP-dependent enzyme [Streptomyces beijiangensis]
MESLAPTAFTPGTTYLNTASTGLLPGAAVTAMHEATLSASIGLPLDMFADVEASRAIFARLAGVPVSRVAAGGSVAVYTGLIATSLPEGAEVLVAEDDFSSLINPFFVRTDLKVRTAPLESLAEAIRPGTALVAVSSVQSADGRLADLSSIRTAARAHGARTLVDASQSAGWLPMTAAQDDYTVAVAFKWLTCPRGITFFVVPEDLGGLTPVFAGWVAGEEPWDSCYGPVAELAHSARRFDESPSLFSYAGARHSLALVEEIGPERIHAHNTALADRFRAGLARLGHPVVAAPGSAIVSAPGLGHRQPDLSEAGVQLSDRAGNLRAAFHLYTTADDVDRALEVIGG